MPLNTVVTRHICFIILYAKNKLTAYTNTVYWQPKKIKNNSLKTQVMIGLSYFPLIHNIISMNNHAVKYVYPLDFQKAKRHRLANRIFKGAIDPSSEECECCGKKIGQDTVQTSCNMQSSKFSFMGPGVPLFFLYLRLAIILLLIMSVLFMGFAIYSNVTSSNCGSSSCSTDIFEHLSILNKLSNATYMEIQSYLALAFVAICIVFFHYFRLKARQLEQQCDEVIDSPSDYAIILRRLPVDVSEADIKEMIKQKKESLTPQQLAKTLNLQVNKIILSYSLHQYNKVKFQSDEEFIKSVQQKRYNQFKPKDLPKPTKTSSIAVVVFESQAAKDYFVYKPNICQKIVQFFCSPCTPLSQFEIKQQKIGIERAPQPDDIFWQNSGITISGGICRKLSTGIISIIILFIGGGAQYGLNSLSSTVTDSTTKSILNIGSSVIVTIFNAILMVVLSALTSKQRNQTLTEFQAVLMVKLTLFQFLNAGVFVVLSQYAANYSTFTLADGMSSQITLIMIMNALTPNLTLFVLDYFQIINKVIIFCVEKGWKICNQKELNELSIGSSIDISKKYAYILKTLWLTALFSPFIPVVIGISMIGLMIFYFLQKILYTKSYSIPNTVSSVTFESAVELLEYFLITFSLGQLIIYFYFYNFQYENVPIRWTATILSTITLAVLNSALPMQAINQKLFQIPQSTHSNLAYTEVQQRFEVTYEMTNPAYDSKRLRKNIKDFLVLTNKQDSKTVAIEMTNLFTATVNKNNQSLMTQKPLLSQYFQKKQEKQESTPKSKQIQILISYNQQGRKQKEKNNQQPKSPEVSKIKQEKNSIPEGQKEKKSQLTNHQQPNIDVVKQNKQPKIQSKPISKMEQTVQKKPVQQPPPIHQIQPNQSAKPPHQINATSNTNQPGYPLNHSIQSNLQNHSPKPIQQNQPNQAINLNQPAQQIQPILSNQQSQLASNSSQSTPKQAQKLRSLLAKKIKQSPSYSIMSRPDVDPLDDNLEKYTPPRFVRKWREEQQKLNVQKPKQQEQPSKITKQQIKLPKMAKQSQVPKKQRANFESNYDNIFSNDKPINTKQVKSDIPIVSKYHASNGKVNIFDQFKDPSHPISLKFFNKKPSTISVSKQKKPHIKQAVIPNKAFLSDPKPKQKFQYLVVKQIKKSEEKKQQQDFGQTKSEQNEVALQTLQRQQPNSQKASKKQLQITQKAMNDAFVDTFGNTSNVSSVGNEHFNDQQLDRKYKINEIQFKDEKKQKKATYNPIPITGGYKNYFNNKIEQKKQDPFTGYLNRKLVMAYLGTPFMNLQRKTQSSRPRPK